MTYRTCFDGSNGPGSAQHHFESAAMVLPRASLVLFSTTNSFILSILTQLKL